MLPLGSAPFVTCSTQVKRPRASPTTNHVAASTPTLRFAHVQPAAPVPLRVAFLLFALCAPLACQQGDPASPAVEPGAGPASDAADAGCLADLPPSCPSPEPTFDADVQPVIARTCVPCHSPGGVAATPFDFTTYGGVAGARGSVLGVVGSCTMPPPGAAMPTPAERDSLLAWLVCGAPQN